MPILKFSITENRITLDGFRMEDITHDKRTSMINKRGFLKEEYKIDDNVYLALNDMFFKMAKFFDKSETTINAMMIKEENNYIIIVPSRSYVFWKGRSVEPAEYKIMQSEVDIMKLLKAVA
jgi:hypothetical protein